MSAKKHNGKKNTKCNVNRNEMCTGNKRNQKMNHILRSKSLINKTFVKRKEKEPSTNRIFYMKYSSNAKPSKHVN